jgi:long-chain acyl-CoA synthetase
METLPSFIEEHAKLTPEKVAVIFEGESLTYQELNRRTNIVRDFLLKHTKKNDRVGVMLENSITFLEYYFGTLKAGCISVLFGPNISDKNLLFEIEDCSPSFLFYEKKYARRIERIGELSSTKALCIDNFTPPEADVSVRDVLPDDFSTIIYTSGTTARPKGVLLRHRNVVQATMNIQEFMGQQPDEIYFNILPLSHSFGLGNVHTTFMVGGTVVIERNAINIPKILSRMKELRVTFFAAVPATLKMICDNFGERLFACKDIRMLVSNTNEMPVSVTETLLRELPNTKFFYYYGLTEASRSTFILFNEATEKKLSVGKASPHTKIEIRDGKDVMGPGEIGEVCIAGPHVIDAYWKNLAASDTIVDGWLHTGDMGYLDEDGYLYLHGRKDDIINIAGEKMSPLEIEELVKDVDDVHDCAAIGLPDEEFGEKVHLFVVSDKSADDLQEQITQAVKGKVESYKVPKSLEIVESIPKTDSGKVQRVQLKRGRLE